MTEVIASQIGKRRYDIKNYQLFWRSFGSVLVGLISLGAWGQLGLVGGVAIGVLGFVSLHLAVYFSNYAIVHPDRLDLCQFRWKYTKRRRIPYREILAIEASESAATVRIEFVEHSRVIRALVGGLSKELIRLNSADDVRSLVTAIEFGKLASGELPIADVT